MYVIAIHFSATWERIKNQFEKKSMTIVTDPAVTQLLSSKDDGSALFSRNPSKREDRDRRRLDRQEQLGLVQM